MNRVRSLLWALVIGIVLTGILSLHTSSEIVVGSPEGTSRTTYYGWPVPFRSIAVHTKISMQTGEAAVEESPRVKIQWANLILTFLGYTWSGLVAITLWKNRKRPQPPGTSSRKPKDGFVESWE